VTGCFYQWKQRSTFHSLPLACRDSVQKIDDFLRNKNDPDCLLLGSSVFLVPAVYCEEQRQGHSLVGREADAELKKRLIRCDSAPELQRQLSERLHRSVSVLNLAVAGSNVSDYLAEVKALQASGHKPKLIVCGLSVRDFVQSFFRMNAQNNPAAKLLSANAQKNIDEAMLSDLREGAVASVLREPRRLIASAQTYLTNNAPIKYVPGSDEEIKQKLEQTLTDAPKQAAFVEGQIESYRELLRYCHDHSIPLVIAEVPKRGGWAGIIDSETESRIKTEIAGDCKTYNIPYCNVGTGYEYSDFQDDIHPNEKGGIKLFDKMAAAVVRRGFL
jgi:lysophospholipase L1-like esterase